MVRAGLEDKGQKVSKHDVTVEQKVSVALLASRDDNCLRGGSEDETLADSRAGESECKPCWGKLLLKVMHCNIALLPKKVTNYVT